MAEQETLERVRRIETRITKIGNALGVDVGGAKPSWDPQRRRLQLPTSNCSIAECLAVVPLAERSMPIAVYVGRDYLTTLSQQVS